MDLWCALLPLALLEVRARALRVHALRAPAAAERSSYGSHGTQGLRLSGAVAAPFFQPPPCFSFSPSSLYVPTSPPAICYLSESYIIPATSDNLSRAIAAMLA